MADRTSPGGTGINSPAHLSGQAFWQAVPLKSR